MNRYYFNNEQRKVAIGKELKPLVKKCCDATLTHLGASFDAEISVTFTDDKKIRELNLSSRNIDSPTDVLSFPLLDLPKSKILKLAGDVPLGDIVLSLERAKAQADLYVHSYERECAFLTVHSMLHLLGYDHVDKRSEKEMNNICESILSELKIER